MSASSEGDGGAEPALRIRDRRRQRRAVEEFFRVIKFGARAESRRASDAGRLRKRLAVAARRTLGHARAVPAEASGASSALESRPPTLGRFAVCIAGFRFSRRQLFPGAEAIRKALDRFRPRTGLWKVIRAPCSCTCFDRRAEGLRGSDPPLARLPSA